MTRLDFQQEDGLMSSLPLGLNRIKIERSLTTSALAVFVPFVTQELFMGGDALANVWVFIVAPLVGGVLAALVWKFLSSKKEA